MQSLLRIQNNYKNALVELPYI